MTLKKIIVATALVLSATSAAMAQSAWTTGTAADMANEGFPSPYANSLYAYAPAVASSHANGLRAYAEVPHTGSFGDPPLSVDNPALTGGGSSGYNDNVRHDW